MCVYKHDWERPKWKVFKRFNAKIQAQAIGGKGGLMRSQVPCWTQVGSKLVKQLNCWELWARSQLSTLKGVEGCAEALGWD
jgi:hypothetical protein